jgi:hypothetical protein
MPALLSRFAAAESGAVTVDWTVLTASVAGLGLAVGGVVVAAGWLLSDEVDASLRGEIVETSFGTGEWLEAFPDGLAGWDVTGRVFDDPGIGGGSGVMLFEELPTLARDVPVDTDREFTLIDLNLATVGRLEAPDQMTLTLGGVTLGVVEFTGEVATVEGAMSFVHVGQAMNSDAIAAQRLSLYGTGAEDEKVSQNVDRTDGWAVSAAVRTADLELLDGAARLEISAGGARIEDIPGEGFALQDMRVRSIDAPAG